MLRCSKTLLFSKKHLSLILFIIPAIVLLTDFFIVVGAVSASSLVANPGFESGLVGMPNGWETEEWGGNGPSSFGWISDGSDVKSGSGSVRIISSVPNDAMWIQTIPMELHSYKSYLLSAWVKTTNVTLSDPLGGFSTGANISMGFQRSPGIWGTQDWTEENLFFCSGTSNGVTIKARLGFHWSLVTGTAIFDDIELEELDTPLVGQHMVLCLFPEHLVLLENPNSWLQKLDDAYLALQDLVGQTPYEGERIMIQEATTYPGGLMVAGNPILWFQDYVPGQLRQINEYNDLSFGPIHELGHDFDLLNLSKYYMGGNPIHAEHWANFKLTYVADALSSKYPIATFRGSLEYVTLGEFSHTYFVEQAAIPWINSGRSDWQNMSGDAYTGLLYLLREDIGWEPFRQTFRDLAALAEPPPVTDLGKIELFAHLLSANAGVDVTPYFKNWGFDVAPSPDTFPPTVSITSLSKVGTISGTVSISASASDDTGVSRVEFYYNVANLIAADTNSPYSVNWDTTTVSDGSYTLTAKAYDKAGNATLSSGVDIIISNPKQDTTPPVVSVALPQNNSILSGITTISAVASDNIGVTKLEFYHDTTLFATDAASPYSVNWDTITAANGSYILTVKAYDAAGNVGISTPVSITILNEISPSDDTTPPTVSLYSPTSGLTLCCNVAIAAEAFDNVGVTRVEFWLNARDLLASDTTEPYSYLWDSTAIQNGDFTIAAKAYDAAGNYAISNFSTVSIFNRQPEPEPESEPEPGPNPEPESPPPQPPPYLLVKLEDKPSVYQVVSNKKHWVPNPETFNSYGFRWDSIKIVSRQELDSYPRVKLIKTSISPEVYYLTQSGMKRWLPNPEIFLSYGNRWQDIFIINQTELNSYPVNNLIHLNNSHMVYKIEGTGKRWIKSAEVFIRLGFKWDTVAPANQAEFNFYSDGAPIE